MAEVLFRDPVCGRSATVEPGTPATVCGGSRYFFCSRLCQSLFEAFPETYATGGSPTDPGEEMEE